MRIALYIFLGLLFFDGLLVCSLCFRKKSPFKQPEEYSNYLKSVKLTESGKAA